MDRVKDVVGKVVEKAKAEPRKAAAAVVLAAALFKAHSWLSKRWMDAEYIFPLQEQGARPEPKFLGKGDPAIADVPHLVAEMRESFLAGASRPYAVRVQQLRSLLALVEENEEAIIAALAADLGRPRVEAVLYDVVTPKNEIKELIHNLRAYLRPEPVSESSATFPSKGYLYKEPVGLVSVIGTWNFPVMLCLVPLAGAIAGGNCVIVKPSKVAPNVAALLGDLIPKYLRSDIVAVVGHTHEGDRTMTGALLDNKFDHVFFTGSPGVGKVIMEKAAKFLTPCTLELGGKNPVFVAADANVDLAAKRVLWGRMLNAGQQCIAPDYVLIEKQVAPAFYEACKKWLQVFYEGHPETPGTIGRIVNERRMRALKDVLTTHGGEVIAGGTFDMATKYVAPTVLKVTKDSSAMVDELFGPILPVMEVDTVKDAVRYVAHRDKPLSMYIFSSSKATQELILQNTSAGGVTINGTIFHCAHPELPFGGVGASGMGAYHGKATFDTFVHRKPVLRKSTLLDPSFMYPPWTDRKAGLLRFLLSK